MSCLIIIVFNNEPLHLFSGDFSKHFIVVLCPAALILPEFYEITRNCDYRIMIIL